MSSHQVSKIFVIGGTGAQGIPIIQALVADKKYQVLVLTRDPNSRRAQELLALGNVEFLTGTLANEATLHKGFSSCDGAFVNIDGFNTGEKTEMYWAIRAYEIAIEEGVKFFVYGNLEYSLKLGGYDSKFRAGHLDGKGRIGEWILWQNEANKKRMGAALFTTGPYINMVISSGVITTPAVEDGILTWRVPLGEGKAPFVALEDCGAYVRWLFDNTEQSNGLDLKVGIDHLSFTEIAEAFTKVTGKPARYIDVSLEKYWSEGLYKNVTEVAAGYNADPKDPSTMTIKDNFSGFWNVFKYDVLKRRDYEGLDKIHPGRVKTIEEWWRREEKRGLDAGLGDLWHRVQGENQVALLKVNEDGRKGDL